MKSLKLQCLAALSLAFGITALCAAQPSAAHKHARKTASAKHASSGPHAARAHASRPRPAKATTARAAAPTPTHRRAAHVELAVRHTRRPGRFAERFTGNSFSDADALTYGDITQGEDPVVRAAAIEALGNMNGTALAIDPSSGRILAMVNQKLALSPGAEPCSTIKLSVALAALEEGIVTRDTPVNLGGGYHLTLTEALAHSNNLYFETLCRSLGFERVKHYANQFGLGELSGYNIQGEQLGAYPDHELPAA